MAEGQATRIAFWCQSKQEHHNGDSGTQRLPFWWNLISGRLTLFVRKSPCLWIFSFPGDHGFLHICKEQDCEAAFKTVADLNKHVYRNHAGEFGWSMTGTTDDKHFAYSIHTHASGFQSVLIPNFTRIVVTEKIEHAHVFGITCMRACVEAFPRIVPFNSSVGGTEKFGLQLLQVLEKTTSIHTFICTYISSDPHIEGLLSIRTVGADRWLLVFGH